MSPPLSILHVLPRFGLDDADGWSRRVNRLVDAFAGHARHTIAAEEHDPRACIAPAFDVASLSCASTGTLMPSSDFSKSACFWVRCSFSWAISLSSVSISVSC